MARSLEEMVSKGQAKLAAKSSIMASNYNASKSRMVNNYNNLPFGPNTKAAYAAGVSAGVYRSPDAAKWAANYRAKVSL